MTGERRAELRGPAEPCLVCGDPISVATVEAHLTERHPELLDQYRLIAADAARRYEIVTLPDGSILTVDREQG